MNLYDRHSVGFPPHWATYPLEQEVSDYFFTEFFGDKQGIKVNTVWGTGHTCIPEWAEDLYPGPAAQATRIELVTSTLKTNPQIQCVLFYEFADQIESEWEEVVDLAKQLKGEENVRVVGNIRNNHQGWHYFPFWLHACKELFCEYSVQEVLPQNFGNLFLSYNRKPGYQRVQSYQELKKYDLLKHGVFTLGAQCQEAQAVTFPGNLPPRQLQMADDDDTYGIHADAFTLGAPEVWANSFLVIVHETLCNQDSILPLLTEKSFKPIIGMRPFIVIGQRHSTKILKDLGFATFEDVFGNDAVSAVNVCVECDPYALYQELLPRIIHNRNHYLGLCHSDYGPDCVDTSTYI